MLRFLPVPITAGISLFFFMLISFVLPVGVFICAFINLLIPKSALKNRFEKFLNEFPRYWGSSSMWVVKLLSCMTVEVRGEDNLNRETWYLMLSNHSSFSDILLLHSVFDSRVPPLRFFMKSSLKMLPFLGQVCMTLGYPFMKRYTKSQLARNPTLKGKDLAETKRACERFKQMPISIISFAEGTRYTAIKAKRQKSPFKRLLKPRAGGVAFTLDAMSGCLQEVVDVTIVYDTDKPLTFFRFLGGAAKHVIVEFDVHPISKELLGNYQNDREFRVQFQSWLNKVWHKKDERIDQIKNEFS